MTSFTGKVKILAIPKGAKKLVELLRDQGYELEYTQDLTAKGKPKTYWKYNATVEMPIGSNLKEALAHARGDIKAVDTTPITEVVTSEKCTKEWLEGQMPNIEVTLDTSQDADEAAWLAQRMSGIGGSDVGGICGISKWSCPRELYLKKLNLYKEDISERKAEVFMFGHRLEELVASLYSEKSGDKLLDPGKSFRRIDAPHLLANVDRFILDDDGNISGILECKTAAEYARKDWLEGNIPEYYLAQLQHYMYVTGIHQGAIAAILGGNQFIYYPVKYNKAWYEGELLPKLNAFWFDNVLKKVPPPVDGSDACTGVLNEQYKDSKPEQADIAPDDLAMWMEVYKNLTQAIKTTKAEAEKAKNKIKDMLGESEFANCYYGAVTWKPVVTSRLDSKAIRLQHPDIAEQYTKKSSSRRFAVKYNDLEDDDDDI